MLMFAIDTWLQKPINEKFMRYILLETFGHTDKVTLAKCNFVTFMGIISPATEIKTERLACTDVRTYIRKCQPNYFFTKFVFKGD